MGMGMSDEWWSSIDDALRQFLHELAFVLSAAPEIPSQAAHALHSALMMDGDPVRAFLAALSALLASTIIIIGFRYLTRRIRMRGLDAASSQAGAIQLLAWGIVDRIVAALPLGAPPPTCATCATSSMRGSPNDGTDPDADPQTSSLWR